VFRESLVLRESLEHRVSPDLREPLVLMVLLVLRVSLDLRELPDPRE